jgi:hypothetical protein
LGTIYNILLFARSDLEFKSCFGRFLSRPDPKKIFKKKIVQEQAWRAQMLDIKVVIRLNLLGD